jgi:hypothetical protein
MLWLVRVFATLVRLRRHSTTIVGGLSVRAILDYLHIWDLVERTTLSDMPDACGIGQVMLSTRP